MLTFIAILLPTLLGFLIISILLRHEVETPLGERIALSFPLGSVIITLQIFLLGFMRIPLTLFNTAFPVAIEIIALASWMFWQKIPLVPISPEPGRSLRCELTSFQIHWAKKLLMAGLLIWITAKLISVFVMTGLRPIYSWDAWAEWTAGAKVFFYSHSLLLDAPAQDFFGQSAVHRIIYYPLHNPLLQLWISLWDGTFNEISVKFFSPVYLLSLAVCFYYFAAREMNRIAALMMLIIFLSSPLMSYHATELNCDVVLGTYLLLVAVSFLKSIRGNRPYWTLTGIFATEALFIKEQAFLFVLPLILSATIYLKFNMDKTHARIAMRSFFIPFLAILPWYFFIFYYGLGFEALHDYGYSVMTEIFGDDPNRINTYFTFHPEILTGYLYWFVSLNNFNVILFFFPVLLVMQMRFSKESLHLLLPIACYMLSFIFLYMFTMFFSWFMWGVIFFRNTLTFYPVLCLLTVLLIKNIQQSKATSPLECSNGMKR
jgi:4-amino-4-deoxy-L-arabinose transferase-like glycosyltransferase